MKKKILADFQTRITLRAESACIRSYSGRYFPVFGHFLRSVSVPLKSGKCCVPYI